MGSSKKSQVIGYKYYLGQHLALCHGPIDSITKIEVDERTVWEGTNTGSPVTFSKPTLFGGDDREGGVAGTIDFEFGESTQTVNSYLAAQSFASLPAYRGIVSAIFRKVYLGNSPYLKPWRFRATRTQVKNGGEAQWYPSKASIDFKVVEVDSGENWLVAVSISTGDITVDGYDANNTGSVGYADRFGKYAISDIVYAYTRYEYADTYAYGPTPETKTLPIDVNRTYSLTCQNGYWYQADPFMDRAGIRMEFLNSSGQLIAVFDNPGYTPSGAYFQNILSYGPDLNNLVASAPTKQLGDRPYSVAIGDISFTSTHIVFTGTQNDANQRAYDFSFACNALSITQVRVSNVEVASAAYPSGQNGYALVGLAEGPLTARATVTGMNPAHVIRECLTDLDWGMGYAESDIDDVTFMAAADALYTEAMGINILWDRQSTIEEFIQQILNHINATLYVERSTGKFALKLIRDDYVVGNLTVLDESNIISLDSYNKPTIGELTNSVTVSYWDEANAKDGTVTVQDQALIQQQGGVINTTVQYPGFAGIELASKVALRDLKELSTPLASVGLTATREAADLNIGGAFVLTWPDLLISAKVYRITEISFGDGKDNSVKITATEDVFTQPTAAIIGEQLTGWTDLTTAPASLTNRKVIEIPYWDLFTDLSEADFNTLTSASTFVQAIAASNAGDALDYKMYTRTGNNSYAAQDKTSFPPTAQLNGAILAGDTLITYDNGNDLGNVVVGNYAIINDEYVSVTAIDTLYNTITVDRGVLDTVPVPHADDSFIYFSDGIYAYDETEYVATDLVDVKLSPRTSQGQLSIEVVTADSITLVGRQNLPYPPGNLKFNGVAYPVNINSADDLVITWSHRDRLTQTATLIGTTTGDIGPEAGVTYTIKFYDDQGVLFKTVTGETGTTYTYLNEDELAENGEIFPGMTVEIISVRSGLESYQALAHTFNRINGGYGILYGYSYGQVV